MKEGLFAGTRTPRPPGDLKERVLRAARAAARETPAQAPKVWGFTSFDLGWAGALLVLVLCHVIVSFPARPLTPTLPRQPEVAEEAQLEKELGWKGEALVVVARDTGANGETQGRLVQELEHL